MGAIAVPDLSCSFPNIALEADSSETVYGLPKSYEYIGFATTGG